MGNTKQNSGNHRPVHSYFRFIFIFTYQCQHI